MLPYWEVVERVLSNITWKDCGPGHHKSTTRKTVAMACEVQVLTLKLLALRD